MLVRKLPHTGAESPAQGGGAGRAVIMSFSGACRGCLGGDWCGDRLLRNRARLRQIAEAVWSPHCRVPIGAGKTGVDGAGNYESAITGLASHPHDGGWPGPAVATLAREA